MNRFLALLVLQLVLPVAPVFAEDTKPFSFVVLGHVRGDPSEPTLENQLLGEIVERSRRLAPDVVVLTGDMIWGLPVDERPLRDQVVAEWDLLDRSLLQIGKPILRTPGNHDVHDLTTRDVYFERYAELPYAETRGRCRFILLASNWIPEDGDTREMPFVRGQPLSDAQLAFLRRELSDDEAFDHAFVFMHHVLWWDQAQDWTLRVQPILKGSKVRAVFSGDLGPTKYSHVVRDGIRLIQSAIETEQDPVALRDYPGRRLLSAQADFFAHVAVDGPDVRFEMIPVGLTTTERYTLERWRLGISDRTMWQKVYANTVDGTPAQQGLVVGVILFNVGVGVLVTLGFQRWRRRHARSRTG